MTEHRTLFTFIREFIKNPRHTGAICPSSGFLARQMAALVPPGEGKVIELGPGSGPMTHALLSRGIAPNDLILVERTQSFADHLKQRFPQIKVIHGDACRLSTLLGQIDEPIRAIVSSLPLRSMPRPLVQQISNEINCISHPGTRFIQFTYHLHDKKPPFPEPYSGPFSGSEGHIVWRNFPPARVDAFDWIA
ncbi:MAG: class I SAM-dependent methyltransferase [Halothiobacillus sp.]